MTALTEMVGQMVAERPALLGFSMRRGSTTGTASKRWPRPARAGASIPTASSTGWSRWTGMGTAHCAEWSEISLGELCDNIVAMFHEPLKNELPRIGTLLFRVAEGDGERYPELIRILQLFSLFSGDLKMHMTKEEADLFPRIKELEADRDTAAEDLPTAIEQLEVEHETAARAIAEMRELTRDFCPPGDACDAHRRRPRRSASPGAETARALRDRKQRPVPAGISVADRGQRELCAAPGQRP